MHRARIAATAALALSALVDHAAPPPPPPPAPEPTRVIIEAEDMTGVDQEHFGPGKTWQVGRWGHDLLQNMVFGGVWASRLRVAMADATDSPAEAYSDVTIPVAGTYKVWAKYECPPNFNYAFSVRVAPLDDAGKPGAAVLEKTYGLIDAAKHYCFNNKLVRGSLYWNWGIDHDAAEGYEAPLKAGRYRVTIAKTTNPAPAGPRSVDAILITTDLSELSAPRMPRYPLLDELRRANHVYFRFRNLSQQPGKIAWNHWNHRYQDFYTPMNLDAVRFYDAAGKPLESKVKNGVWPEPIAAGAASVWHDLGPTMNVESNSPFRVSMTPADAKPTPTPGPSIPFAVDIALEPNDGKIVKTFTLDAGEPDLAFMVQPDLARKEGVEYTRKLTDIYRELTEQLNAEPRVGPIPKNMKFFAGTAGPRSSGEDLEITEGFRHALGLNTFATNLLDKAKLDAIEAWWQTHGGIIHRSLAYHHETKDISDVVKKAGVQDRFHYVSYGDEIGLPAVNLKDAAAVAAFVEFVKSRGETPQTLGVAGWEQVKPLANLSPDVAVQIGVLPADAPKTADQSTRLKRLYWYSNLFREQQGIAAFAARTRQLKAALGEDVQTSANLGGMHPFYWMHQGPFIEAFKGGAMTLAWSEDYTYCQPEGSRLVADFEAAYLRKGASYHDTRMMFYCMPHWPGNSPQLLMQNAVMQWANNVKDIDWFFGGPDAWSTENYVAYRGGMPTWKTMRTVSGMAGAIEDDLVPARPDPTPVAMLLSQASDVWELAGGSQGEVTPAADGKPASVASNVSQEERKAIWYALRNAGYRVDFVTENDAADGLLKNYKALYVCGQNVERKAAGAIRQWVQDGGVLFATAGAARKDEFDEPSTTLDEALGRGVQKGYERYRGPLRAKIELPFQKPLDQVRLNSGDAIAALCSKESFEAAPGAQVLGTYADNYPAYVKRGFGKGVGHYIGALPGLGFLKSAVPAVPMGKGGSETNSSIAEPVDHDLKAAALIVSPLSDAGILPDVASDRRGIVSGRLSSAKSIVLPVVHLREHRDGQAKDPKIVVRNVAAKPARVWSCFYPKGVPFDYADGVLTLTLPTLQTADVIVVVR